MPSSPLSRPLSLLLSRGATPRLHDRIRMRAHFIALARKAWPTSPGLIGVHRRFRKVPPPSSARPRLVPRLISPPPQQRRRRAGTGRAAAARRAACWRGARAAPRNQLQHTPSPRPRRTSPRPRQRAPRRSSGPTPGTLRPAHARASRRRRRAGCRRRALSRAAPSAAGR